MIIKERIEAEGQGVAREVFVINGETHEVITVASSDHNGNLEVTIPEGLESVLLVSQDDQGSPFVPGMAYKRGQRIRSPNIDAFRFEVYLEGVTSDVEPVWPQKSGELISSGSVTLRCIPYYRPIAKFIPL